MLSDSISDQGSRTGVCPVSISKAMFYRCHDVVVGNGPPLRSRGAARSPTSPGPGGSEGTLFYQCQEGVSDQSWGPTC